ncbi:MAG: alkylhydroperoxidase [Flammeovirgaceae bacterium]|nr:alkylhydroperoxidase [Flammeovirgaceae bacterium]MBE61422.1 alkylhydroperoxidase [Flammeovirgaceae bacterium]MBR09803.1 alkylhydroperoxidase [Rickettsiales bacterium]HCX22132.1 alkylhydroperoxidase [Cytophagales bacterium]|tara:strand:+ start:882 stop:1433 length:552 start_codon:yes stop_codon:yes gene_type:complete
METRIAAPTREQVSENNQQIFDQLQGKLGFVPNLYASYAHNDTALADYLALQNRKSTLKAKEREVINLVVSQVNECIYCLSAHTAIGKMNGFTDEQILEIRTGKVSFDNKLDALAQLAKDAVENRTRISAEKLDYFFEVGYTKANLIDVLIVIGDKMISNMVYGATTIPVDFPVAPELESVTV